jgi:hypothetical protein
MLKNYTLLKSQKHRVYELLQQGGLEPAEFSWVKEEIAGSLIVSRLNYRDGTSYFQFSSHEVNAWCTACPGQFRHLDYEYPKSWEEQEGVFKKWVACLKREVASPDPWEELAKYRIVLGDGPAAEAANEAISAYEAGRIAAALARVGDMIVRELVLDDERAALVRSKLAYLAEAAQRQKSLDWAHTALGVYVTLGATLGIPEATLAALWEMFRSEVCQFVHMAPPNPAAAARAEAPPKTPIVSTEPRPAPEPQVKPHRKPGLFF